MTADLETVLADYRTGLDAELAVLAHIEDHASRQSALPYPAPPETLTHLALERERHLAALTALEQQVQPLRQHVGARLNAARQMPGFAGVADRHRRAAEIVARIMVLDEQCLEILKSADADRRTAVHRLEAGGATLAAYRRILEQPQPSAGLFDQRG